MKGTVQVVAERPFVLETLLVDSETEAAVVVDNTECSWHGCDDDATADGEVIDGVANEDTDDEVIEDGIIYDETVEGGIGGGVACDTCKNGIVVPLALQKKPAVLPAVLIVPGPWTK